VGIDAVHAYPEHLRIQFSELVESFAELGDFGRAHEREVQRIKKEHNPFSSIVLKMYIPDLAFEYSLHFEAQCFLANLYTHIFHLLLMIIV
jgi:hypothetical protein